MISLGDAISEFLEYVVSGISVRSQRNYRCTFNKLGQYAPYGSLVSDISEPVLAKMIHQPDITHGDKLSPETRRKYYRHLNHFFKFCRRRKWIQVNPVEDMKAPTCPKHIKFILTKDQMQRIMDKLAGPYKDLFIIYKHTGRRAGEVLPNGSESWTPPIYDQERNKLMFFMTKTHRWISYPVPNGGHPLQDIVKRYVNDRGELNFGDLTARNFWSVLRGTGKSLGIKVDIQCLRRSLATYMLDQDFSPQVVASILGNTVQTLMENYGHILDSKKREVIEKFDY